MSLQASSRRLAQLTMHCAPTCWRTPRSFWLLSYGCGQSMASSAQASCLCQMAGQMPRADLC